MAITYYKFTRLYEDRYLASVFSQPVCQAYETIETEDDIIDLVCWLLQSVQHGLVRIEVRKYTR